MSIITFLSDFGQKDGYVGCVEGMILSLNPDARIINISHNISPYQIEQGAYVLMSYYNYYPKGTIHLAVIDPGVGSMRLPLIVETKNYYFVGPDNGLFSYIFKNEKYQIYVIAISKISKHTSRYNMLSSTFHARDIFGPAAALLSRGENALNLGEPHSQKPVTITGPVWNDHNQIIAKIIAIDHFGNIITNVARSELEQHIKKIDKVVINDNIIDKIENTYSAVPKDALLALWGSSGYLEISVNQGSAAKNLNCKIGQNIIEVYLKDY
jgi:S-adenosylmethionine hydrolase